MFDVANHVFATVAGHLQPNVTKQRHRYYYLFYFILFFLTPVLNSQGMKKITPCSTKKYKNQAGIKLTPPPAVKWHLRLQYNIEKRNNKQKSTTE